VTERSCGVPDRYHSVNPYIVVAEVERFIDFLRDVSHGVERGEREISRAGYAAVTALTIAVAACCPVVPRHLGWMFPVS